MEKHMFDLQLNSITDSDNPTKKEVEFILHDFDISHNSAFISKENAEKVLDTIENTPIVCQYFPVSSVGADDDALGSHGVMMDRDRNNGDEFVTMNTLPIGVFTEPAYIKTVVENGVEKEVVAAKGVLWQSRFPNIISLIKQWFDEGIKISSSMEILYDKYSVDENGIIEIQNFLYEGHCILNSEDRGERKKVLPAYDVSKLTKLVAEALNIESKEEKEKMTLSHNEIRELLQEKIQGKLANGERTWVVDVYEGYLIANIYKYSDDESYDGYFKIDYTRNEDEFTVLLESKSEVKNKPTWVEVSEYDTLKNELEQVKAQVSEKEEKINEISNQLNSISTEKLEIETKFNSASEQLAQLNSLVEELAPIKIQFETEKLEKAISEQMDFYFEKFSALNAKDKFETDEVQDLVRKTVCENDEGREAKLSLNTMLVDLVTSPTTQKETTIREVASKRKDLLPTDNSFESRYSI